MDVRNCRKCRKIFNYIAGPQICPQCRAAMEEKFSEVRKYVYANKGATMPEISEACDVELSQIQAWVREERLVFADDSPIGIGCEICGDQIKTGRYCTKCKTEMTNTLNSALPKSKIAPQQGRREEDNPRMRFL